MKRNRTFSLLVKLANIVDFKGWHLLKDVEDMIAPERVVTCLPKKLDAPTKRFVLLTTLPYVFGSKLPKARLDEVWNDEYKVVPTGNMNPKFMVVAQDDFSTTRNQALLDRCWSSGLHSEILRVSLLKAGIYYDSWLTVFNKTGNRLLDHAGLMNEVKMLRPEVMIIVGEWVNNFDFDPIPTIHMDHPLDYVKTGKETDYAKHVKKQIA